MKNVNHLPYDTIVQACRGEPIAVNTVLSHYDRYIKYVSIVSGKVHPDTEEQVKAKLIEMILSILVDTFFTRISMPKLLHPGIHNISDVSS